MTTHHTEIEQVADEKQIISWGLLKMGDVIFHWGDWKRVYVVAF